MSILLIKDGIFEGRAYVYPGQTFKIPVLLYRQWNESVPGNVQGELVNKSRSAHFAGRYKTWTWTLDWTLDWTMDWTMD